MPLFRYLIDNEWSRRGYVCVKQCPNYAPTVPRRALLSFEAEVMAAGGVGFAFAPFQLLDGFAEHGEVGDIFGLQVITECVLDAYGGL